MKVLYKAPGKHLRQMVIPNGLETLQDLVGGYIEPVTLSDRLVLLVNEEGKLRDMDMNFYLPGIKDVIVGPAIFLGVDGEEFADIHEEDCKLVKAFFEYEIDKLGGVS